MSGTAKPWKAWVGSIMGVLLFLEDESCVVQPLVRRAAGRRDRSPSASRWTSRGRYGSKPVDAHTASYQCGAHTPSLSRGPGGHASIRSVNPIPSQSQSHLRYDSGSRRKSAASTIGVSSSTSSSRTCCSSPMSSGSQTSRERRYDATTSSGRRISSTLR